MHKLEKFQIDIINAAKDFAKGEFDKQLALEYDKKGVFPREIIKKAGELGFIGLHIDEEYGGTGLGYFEDVLLLETLAQFDSTFAAAIMSTFLGAEIIYLLGSKEQKKNVLPKVIEGDTIISSALNYFYNKEIGGSVDVVPKKKDSFVLRGEYGNIINGVISDFLIVGVNRKIYDDHHGIGLFLVDTKGEGIKVIPQKSLGWSMCPNAKIIFNNVEIKEFIGDSYHVIWDLYRIWASEMFFIASIAIGIAQGSYIRALDHVKKRIQFNRKIIEFPVTQNKLANMLTKIHMARLCVYDAAKRLSTIKKNYSKKQLKDILSSIAMAKLTATKVAKEVSDEAIQLLGGYGYMREYVVERYYRDAKCCELIGGNYFNLNQLIFNMSA